MAEQYKQEIKGDNRDIGVVGKGTRDDKDLQTNRSVFLMSNPPDKNQTMAHLDEAEAN